MKKLFKSMPLMSVLAASLFLWGCDAVQEPIQPRLSPNGMVVMSTDGVPYVVAMETNPAAEQVSAVIGAEGGELGLANGHKVFVSAGAVNAPTTFTLRRYPEEPLRVKLTAGRDAENDVGAAGFSAPVTLQLSYAGAGNLPDNLDGLTLIYFRNDGLVETLSTQVDTGAKTIRASLPHFSLFGLAWGTLGL